MRAGRIVVAVQVAALVLGAVALPAAAGPAPPPDGCTQTDALGNCVRSLPIPIRETPDETGDNDARPAGTAPSGHPAACPWVTVSETEALRSMHPEAPPDAIWQVANCGDLISGVGVRWLPPGSAAPAPPSVSAVASLLYATVKAQMAAPDVSSSPAAGVASVVDVPVFVEVTNWQPEIVDDQCVLGVCVTMTATPSLSFDPGDGSEPVPCEPPGSRYVEGGGSLAEQAEGACAHAYRMRTGVEGRPAEWLGEVQVTWAVSWTSNQPPGSGSFDPLVFTTALPRVVDEVGAVVTDGET